MTSIVDYPDHISIFSIFKITNPVPNTVRVCNNCEDKFIEDMPNLMGYSVLRVYDFGTCSICGSHTIKKHLYIKSRKEGRK